MAKLLLVEDDNNLREIYEARLAAEGYEISSAQDGEEALVVAKQTKPDLVISDVMMPKISGFEMLDILRNTPGLEHVKVIMLTALGQNEDRDRADTLGADKYLVKSQVTLEDIVKTAHELLEDAEPAPVAAAAASATTPQPSATPAPEPAALAVEPAPTPSEASPEVASEPVVTAPAVDDASSTTQAVDDTSTDDAVAAPVPEPQSPASTAATENSEASTPTAAPEAGSTAQEEAVIENQINSFVESAPNTASEVTPTPEPTTAAPASEPTTEPAPVPNPEVTESVTPVAEPATPAATTAATAADDQLMANAVEELANEAPVEPTPVITEPETPEEPAAETTPENSDISETKDEAAKTNIAIAGKKVIQPLESQPKPDINELLAQEEAKADNVAAGPAVISASGNEAGQVQDNTNEPPAIVHQPGQSFTPQPGGEQPAPVSAPSEDDQPSGAPAPAPSEQKDGSVDPNSIAL